MHTSRDYINMLPVLTFSTGVSFCRISTSYDDWIMIFLSRGVLKFFLKKAPLPWLQSYLTWKTNCEGRNNFLCLMQKSLVKSQRNICSGRFTGNSVLSTYCNKNLHFSMYHHVTTWLPWKRNNSLTFNFFINWFPTKF